jgi:hypothetical protein
MSDFSTDQPKPQNSGDTLFGPHNSDVPEGANDNSEPTKLGSESIANFGAPHGVAPGGTKIH